MPEKKNPKDNHASGTVGGLVHWDLPRFSRVWSAIRALIKGEKKVSF